MKLLTLSMCLALALTSQSIFAMKALHLKQEQIAEITRAANQITNSLQWQHWTNQYNELSLQPIGYRRPIDYLSNIDAFVKQEIERANEKFAEFKKNYPNEESAIDRIQKTLQEYNTEMKQLSDAKKAEIKKAEEAQDAARKKKNESQIKQTPPAEQAKPADATLTMEQLAAKVSTAMNDKAKALKNNSKNNSEVIMGLIQYPLTQEIKNLQDERARKLYAAYVLLQYPKLATTTKPELKSIYASLIALFTDEEDLNNYKFAFMDWSD